MYAIKSQCSEDVFRFVEPCRLVEVNRHVRGAHCLSSGQVNLNWASRRSYLRSYLHIRRCANMKSQRIACRLPAQQTSGVNETHPFSVLSRVRLVSVQLQYQMLLSS